MNYDEDPRTDDQKKLDDEVRELFEKRREARIKLKEEFGIILAPRYKDISNLKDE